MKSLIFNVYIKKSSDLTAPYVFTGLSILGRTEFNNYLGLFPDDVQKDIEAQLMDDIICFEDNGIFYNLVRA